VENEQFSVRDKKVVELGAGLGLCGLVSSKLGAKSVILTDREGFALHCALSTAALNGLENVSATVLDWADDSQLVGTTCADIVLASDVLYDPVTIELLARACVRIGVPACLVLVTDPLNSRYPNARDIFQKALEASGGKVDIINLPLNEYSEGETMEGRDYARRMQEPTVLIKCVLTL
jgi:predicted nicotinamide N-methyase